MTPYDTWCELRDCDPNAQDSLAAWLRECKRSFSYPRHTLIYMAECVARKRWPDTAPALLASLDSAGLLDTWLLDC